jgi:peptide chain release factor subunit 1
MQTVLILTPVKNAARFLDGYFERLGGLTYPHNKISIGLLESDSSDGTYAKLLEISAQYAQNFSRVMTFKHDFGFTIPTHLPRWEASFQLLRRNILARSRNQLLFRALADQDWVLWLDVDVISYPSNLVERLLGYDLDIVHPDCVQTPDGPSFDRNAWKDDGKLYMHDLRGTGRAVRIDSVGGTVLLVRADVHRDGLIFPAFRYGVESKSIRTRHPLWDKGEIETEGLAAMARDMGLQCWGIPDLQVVHA